KNLAAREPRAAARRHGAGLSPIRHRQAAGAPAFRDALRAAALLAGLDRGMVRTDRRTTAADRFPDRSRRARALRRDGGRLFPHPSAGKLLSAAEWRQRGNFVLLHLSLYRRRRSRPMERRRLAVAPAMDPLTHAVRKTRSRPFRH